MVDRRQAGRRAGDASRSAARTTARSSGRRRGRRPSRSRRPSRRPHRLRDEAAALPIHVRADALAHVSRTDRRARRRDRPADQRGERQADLLGARPRSAGPCRCSGSPPRRPGAGPARRCGSTPTRPPRAGSPMCAACPKGPVLAISPFNFPLNLVAHKVAPAIAVGAPRRAQAGAEDPAVGAAARPSSSPRPTCRRAWSASLNVPNDQAVGPGRRRAAAGRLLHRLGAGRVVDPEGRAAQARDARARRQRRRVVCSRLTPARPTSTGRRPGSRTFSNYQAGQSCIGVQRVYVADGLYDDFKARLLVGKVGRAQGRRPARRRHPGRSGHQRTTRPSGSSAWIEEAVAAGATVLAGGGRDGTTDRADRARGRAQPTPRSRATRSSGRS